MATKTQPELYGRFMAITVQRNDSDGNIVRPKAGPVLIHAVVNELGMIEKADYDMVISARELTPLLYTKK